METIFGLLVILLPLIFKLIGKKLEQAGNLEKAKRFQELAERMTSDSDEDSKKNTIEVSEIDFNDAVKQQSVAPAYVPKKEERPVVEVRKKQVAVEKEKIVKKEEREKIDPKKLVIYSEIMNRKF
jgi:hypothetical protein